MDTLKRKAILACIFEGSFLYMDSLKKIHWKEDILLCWRRYRHSPKGSPLRSDGIQFGSHKRTINASPLRGYGKEGGRGEGEGPEGKEKNIDIRLGIFLEGKSSSSRSSSSREQVFRARIEQVQSYIAPATVAEAQVITPTAKFALSPLSSNCRTKEYFAVVAVFLISSGLIFFLYCIVIHARRRKNYCSFYRMKREHFSLATNYY